jgi:hypothetical protein
VSKGLRCKEGEQAAVGACAVLRKGQEVSNIMHKAIKKGCNVGSHSVWLPPQLQEDCRNRWSFP